MRLGDLRKHARAVQQQGSSPRRREGGRGRSGHGGRTRSARPSSLETRIRRTASDRVLGGGASRRRLRPSGEPRTSSRESQAGLALDLVAGWVREKTEGRAGSWGGPLEHTSRPPKQTSAGRRRARRGAAVRDVFKAPSHVVSARMPNEPPTHPHATSRLTRASAEPAPRCTPRSSTTVPRDDPQPSNAQRLQTDAYRRGGRGAGERLGIFSGGRHAPRAVGVEGRWAGASWAEAPGRGLQTSSF